MDNIDIVFATSYMVCIVCLCLIGFLNYREEKIGIETPGWIVDVVISVFLVFVVIYIISALLKIFN